MIQTRENSEATFSKPRLLLVFIIFSTALWLGGCVGYDIVFYPKEEWKIISHIKLLHGMSRQPTPAEVEAVIEKKALEWRGRDVQFEWHIEKIDEDITYVINAEGKGWRTLNELAFDNHAVIQPTKNPGEISFSCDCVGVLPPTAELRAFAPLHRETNLTLTGGKIVSANAFDTSYNTAEWKWIVYDTDKTERLEAVFTEAWKFPLPVNSLAWGALLVLFAPPAFFAWRKRSFLTDWLRRFGPGGASLGTFGAMVVLYAIILGTVILVFMLGFVGLLLQLALRTAYHRADLPLGDPLALFFRITWIVHAMGSLLGIGLGIAGSFQPFQWRGKGLLVSSLLGIVLNGAFLLFDVGVWIFVEAGVLQNISDYISG